MKEKVAIRLYEQAHQGACCESAQYFPAVEVRGWNYQRGDQIGLHEREGGFLMGAIDHIDPAVREDETGRYKLATIWTLD
jgi:hypothetical protein